MKTEEKNSKLERISLSGIIIVLAVLFIVIGLTLAFLVPETITLKQICYVLGLFILAGGIVFIVRYFVRESYRNVQEYGFSIGVALVITGIMVLIRADPVAEHLLFALGALALMASILKLQTAMDLNALHDRSFILWLCIAVAFAICAVVIVMDPFKNPYDQMSFAQYVLIADGVISLAGTLYLSYRVREANKQAAKTESITTTSVVSGVEERKEHDT